MGLFRSARPVGLELSAGHIKAVQLSGTARSPRIAALGQIALPPKAVADGAVTDEGLVAGALGELWEKCGFSSREIIMGVSNHGVLMRLVRFPRVPEKKLDKALRFQAGDYFPIPLSQIVLDYSVIKGNGRENDQELEVLLVAAQRDMLDRYLQAAAGASLSPLIIDASTLALLRVLPKEKAAGNIALIDVSGGLSSLLIVSGGVPRFARVILNSLQPSFYTQLNYPPEESSEILGQVAATLPFDSDSTGGQYSPVSQAAILAGEIHSSIDYYLAQSGEVVDSVVLSGCGAQEPGLAELLHLELDVPVEIINPLDRLSGPAYTRGIDPERDGPGFAVALGLALRGLEV